MFSIRRNAPITVHKTHQENFTSPYLASPPSSASPASPASSASYDFPSPQIFKAEKTFDGDIQLFGPSFLTDVYPRLEIRQDTFKYMVDYLDKIDSPVIVETGTARIRNNWSGDGQSTLIWDRVIQYRGGEAWSIDLDPNNVQTARSQTNYVNYIIGDSVTSLHQLAPTIPDIDLLYLDSFDLDWSDPHPSSLHHIKELVCIFHRVKKGGLIAVDDNSNGKGKGAYVADFLKNLGCEIAFDSYQIGFIKSV